MSDDRGATVCVRVEPAATPGYVREVWQTFYRYSPPTTEYVVRKATRKEAAHFAKLTR